MAKPDLPWTSHGKGFAEFVVMRSDDWSWDVWCAWYHSGDANPGVSRSGYERTQRSPHRNRVARLVEVLATALIGGTYKNLKSIAGHRRRPVSI